MMESLLQSLGIDELDGPAALTFLGLLAAIYTTYSIIYFIAPFVTPSKIRRYAHPSADGKPAWALVTGASDGIGRALAHELAGHGFNVVIHGRNPSKLDRVEADLVAAFPERSFRVLVADSSALPCLQCMTEEEVDPSHDGKGTSTDTHPISLPTIARSLSDLHLTVVINNAGGGPNPHFATLDAFPTRTMLANVNVNALFPLLLLQQLVPQLARAAPALIINVGSLADNGIPMLAFYGPSKALLMVLSKALGLEVALARSKGGVGEPRVEVLGIRVGEVTGTSFNDARGTLFEPRATTMARAMLARVGCGRRVVIGYLPHALQQLGVDLLPRWAMEWVVTRTVCGLREAEQRRLKGL